jgi:LPXTG-motif cell wall-anchored protein
MIGSEDNLMFKKIRAILLAGFVASALAVSAGAQTEDFSYWRRKGPSNWLLITIGALVLIIIIGAVYLMRRRNAASK